MPSLKVLVLGGERIEAGMVEAWGGRLRIVQGWGLTETGICSTWADLTPQSPYPDSIGRSVGCAVWIVDRHDVRKCLPIGAMGELVVEGPGVARGYCADGEELEFGTAFIPAPAWAPARERSHRFYRTRDMARYNADGSLHFCGRIDDQVKVRGQRFQLQEVEHALLKGSANDLEAFTCMVAGDLIGVLSLTARSKEAVTATLALVEDIEGAPDLIASVERSASQVLPSYMMPAAWFVVEKLPRSTSSKLDRNRIFEWLQGQDIVAAKRQLHARQSTATVPFRGTEQLLQEIWSSVTGVEADQIFRETSFIELGGDSILAVSLVYVAFFVRASRANTNAR